MRSILLALAAVLAYAPQASAVDLESATNQQILRELSRRLDGSGGGETASATYVCDSSGYLQLTLSGSTTPATRSIYTGSFQACNGQSSALNAHKSEIRVATTIAACDSSGYLTQYLFRPNGTITDAGSTYTGSSNNCLPQAKQINGTGR